MTDYISEYTGEEIDAGIAKANMVYNALPKVSDEGDNLTLDGTANCPMKMELKGNTEQTTYTGKNLINDYDLINDTNIYILSNKFKGISWGAIYGTDTTTKNAISNYNNESSTEGRIVLRIDNNIASTIETLRTYLSNNNTTVYYVLATPTNEEITDTTLISQLNAIENAVSYDTQTNIVQENYSEPFIINAECVRSLKDIFELIQ